MFPPESIVSAEVEEALAYMLQRNNIYGFKNFSCQRRKLNVLEYLQRAIWKIISEGRLCMSAMRSNCGDGCTWSFQNLEAYRRWGSRVTWVACSTGRSVDSAAATRNPNPLPCNYRDFVQHQNTSQEQEQVLSSFNNDSQGKQIYRLIALFSYSLPESHDALVADPGSPHPA